MSILVAYKSRTGFTQRYAQWISEELSCDIIDYDKLNKTDLSKVDTLIYGGRVHAGFIDKIKKIKPR